MKINTQIRNKVASVATPTIAEGTGVTLNTTNKTVFVTEFTIPSTVQAVASAALGFGIKLGTLPKGAIVVQSADFDMSFTCSGACTDTPEMGIGTVVATGAIATLGAGSASMEDCIDGTAIAALTGAAPKAIATTIAGETDTKDGVSTAKSLYLNFADTWTASVNITITGKVTVAWYIAHTS